MERKYMRPSMKKKIENSVNLELFEKKKEFKF